VTRARGIQSPVALCGPGREHDARPVRVVDWCVSGLGVVAVGRPSVGLGCMAGARLHVRCQRLGVHHASWDLASGLEKKTRFFFSGPIGQDHVEAP